MAYTITAKDINKRIILITLSNPVNARNESNEIMAELQAILGTLTNTVYTIYDFRQVTVSFSDIVTGISSSIARPRTEFEKDLSKHGRLVLVGSGTVVAVAAKTSARFLPDKPFPVFQTPEEAVDYAQAELAKHPS